MHSANSGAKLSQCCRENGGAGRDERLYNLAYVTLLSNNDNGNVLMKILILVAMDQLMSSYWIYKAFGTAIILFIRLYNSKADKVVDT